MLWILCRASSPRRIIRIVYTAVAGHAAQLPRPGSRPTARHGKAALTKQMLGAQRVCSTRNPSATG